MSATLTSTSKSRPGTSKGRRAPLPRCVECDMNFTNLNQWQEHRKRIHGIAASHLCTICSFASTDIQLLNHHLLKSHHIVQPRCIQCDLTFDNVALWRKHCDEAHQGQKAYPCQKCGFITLDFNEYKEHIYTAHTIFAKKPSQITCQVCNEKFDSSNELKQHALKKHSNAYKCAHCEFAAANQNELTEHLLTNLCDKFIRCEECGLLCKGMEKLNNHMGTHKRGPKLSTNNTLEEADHERVRGTPPQLNNNSVGQLVTTQDYNNGILQGLLSDKQRSIQATPTTSAPTSFVAQPLFPCEHCSALFRNMEDWQLHQMTTHNATVLEAKKPNPSNSNTKSIDMRCQPCKISFSDIGIWRKHIKDVHPLEAYVCYLCDFTSQRKGLMEKHLTSVHKVRDFPTTALLPQCKDCSQSFVNIKLWKFHRNTTHCKEEYFSCEDCDFSSSVYQFFNNHREEIHKEPTVKNIGDTIQCIGPNCDKIFYSVSDYTDHRTKEHSHYYKCHLGCDFKTLVKEELIHHLSYHKNPGDGKRVVTARTITPNILSRNNSKMINCEICAYKTNTRIRMTNHYRQTHRQLYEFQPVDTNYAGPSTSNMTENASDTRMIDLPTPSEGSSIRYLQNLCQYADPTESGYRSKLGKVALGKRNQNSVNPSKKLKYSTLNEGASTSFNQIVSFDSPKIVHVTSLSGLAFNGINENEQVAEEQRDEDFANQPLQPINLIDTQSSESGEYEMILPDLDYDEDDSNEATPATSETKVKCEPDLSKVKTEPIDANETENRKIEPQSSSTTGSTSQWDQQPIKSEPQ